MAGESEQGRAQGKKRVLKKAPKKEPPLRYVSERIREAEKKSSRELQEEHECKRSERER